MSNKPKIHGFCEAGCKWETVHRDEFERSASVIACRKETMGFELKPNKTYRIRKTTDLDDSLFGFDLRVRGLEETTGDAFFDTVYTDSNLPVDGQFREYLTVTFFGVYWAWDGTRATIMNINGEIYTQIFSDQGSTTAPEVYSNVSLFAVGAEECYLVNEFATITAKEAETPVSIDLSAFETDGKIVETFADGTSKTTTMEFDESGNPVKITDSDGNETVLNWKKAFHTITYNAPNCTIDPMPATVADGGSIESWIYADDGYSFDTMRVTMGGVDITDTALATQGDQSQFRIESVTGDVVVTITTIGG